MYLGTQVVVLDGVAAFLKRVEDDFKTVVNVVSLCAEIHVKVNPERYTYQGARLAATERTPPYKRLLIRLQPRLLGERAVTVAGDDAVAV